MSLRASVVYVKNTTVAYPACSTPGCNKKVIEENPGSWWCEKCQASFPEPQYRYVLSVNVADHTGTLWLSCFDEAGQMIVGMSANEVMKVKEADEENNTTGNFMNIMQDATCKTFNFRVRAKMETYQDQPK
jgi:replication factor A1